MERTAKTTLTAVEMDHGETLRFRMQNGRVCVIELVATDAAIVERVTPGGIVYRFSAVVRIDGESLRMQRYVCSQECFYEPYVINGVRVWLDIVDAVFDLIPVRYPGKGNLRCRPRKDARFALQDATLRICPQETHPWIDDLGESLDVGRCYNGDDCYLGPYLGKACHVGMDINHPKGSRLYLPVDVDTQAYFNSLEAGHNNNRWRGIRRWPNGDVWAIQTHHLIGLLVPQNTPQKAGTAYATTAGVHVGSHQHTHFEFKVAQAPRSAATTTRDAPAAQASIDHPVDFGDPSPRARGNPEVLHLDPWILFWQILEDRRVRRGDLRPRINPFVPARTGVPLVFTASSAAGSLPPDAHCSWAFGDGTAALGHQVAHAFASPGVYPVTLVVEHGREAASATQHLTVSGAPVLRSALAIRGDAICFQPRSPTATDVYAAPVTQLPYTLPMTASPWHPSPTPAELHVHNLGAGTLDAVRTVCAQDWLRVTTAGEGNRQTVMCAANAGFLPAGDHTAVVELHCANSINPVVAIRVRLRVQAEAPPTGPVVIDDGDRGFAATPWAWVGHRFCRCPAEKRGVNGFYLVFGGEPGHPAVARFTPDLAGGFYTVSFPDETPFPDDTAFSVRVHHAAGDSTVRVKPRESRRIGGFEFSPGTAGFVEILTAGAAGTVIADAVRFEPRQQ